MLKFLDHKKMGRGRHGWLDSHFHFSFAEYRNPANVSFGVLRVFNDDIVKPGEGFDAHPHRDMEIISYVVYGELSHRDSMGNDHTLTRGQAQYMSAGTGVMHSEYNHTDEDLRFAQIWIFPDKQGYPPVYGDYRFELEERYDRWMPIATGYDNRQSTAPIKVHQDINAYATILCQGSEIDFKVAADRQAYLVCLEGQATVGAIVMEARDALEITSEDVHVKTSGGCHLFVIEMALDASGR
jgi:redox-sensitive bicupin YhaK (pirin superfamily)